MGTFGQRFGANLFFAKFCCKFLTIFQLFCKKMLKMYISTRVWSVEHNRWLKYTTQRDSSFSIHLFILKIGVW